MDKTLFVLPLEDRFKCQAHKGLLQQPIKATCGHNFCKGCSQKTSACPADGAPFKNDLQNDIQADINELLCYCKYGTTTKDNGQLIADPKGCDHIIKYGNKAQHEAQCEFRDEFIMINKGEEPKSITESAEIDRQAASGTHTNLLPCANKDDGCFFLAESEDERKLHLVNECPYERLRGLLRQSESRAAVLEREIKLRDDEIAELRAQLESRGDSFAKRTVDSGKEMLEEIVRILEEELPNGLSAAKGQISPAFQRTSTSISALKSKVIKKTSDVKRGLSQVHPLERLGEINPLAGAHPIDRLIEINPLAGSHPIDRLIAILSQLKQGLVSAVHDTSSSSNNNNNTSLVVDHNDLGISGEYDEDTKKQIAASLVTYENESQSRQALEDKEAAAIAAAAALSLAENFQQE